MSAFDQRFFDFEAVGDGLEAAGPALDVGAPEPVVASEPAQIVPSGWGDDERQLLHHTAGTVSELAQMIQEARQQAAQPAPQFHELPEYDPFDQNSVAAHMEHHFGPALAEIAQQLAAVRGITQDVQVDRGGQVFERTYKEITAHLPEGTPGWVGEQLQAPGISDLALAMSQPYVAQGIHPTEALQHTTAKLAVAVQQAGERAVAAKMAELEAAATRIFDPRAGETSGQPGVESGWDEDSGESVYRQQGRRTLSRLNGTVPV